MKRNLYGSIKAMPYTSGTAVDRQGYLSAVVSASASAAGTLAVAVTECDTADGSFTAVADERVVMGRNLSNISVVNDELMAVELDLVGCKRYIKVTVTPGGSAAATYALVLGDPTHLPVEE